MYDFLKNIYKIIIKKNLNYKIRWGGGVYIDCMSLNSLSKSNAYLLTLKLIIYIVLCCTKDDACLLDPAGLVHFQYPVVIIDAHISK